MGTQTTREKPEITTWNPMRELQEMSHRMGQLFGSSLLGRSSLLDVGGEAMKTPAAWAPSVNVSERDDEYRITAEIPAVEKKDLHVRVDNGVLCIEGERRRHEEKKGEHYHRVESYFGSFVRRFTIPEDADAEKIDARLENGMLDIHIPKLPTAQRVSKVKEVDIR